MRSLRLIAITLLLCRVLSGCGDVVIAPNLEQLERMEEALRYPRGPQYNWIPVDQGITLTAEERPDLTFSRLDPPAGLFPLGMNDSSSGYLIDKVSQDILWLYDYSNDQLQPILDYRNTALTMGSEIAFSANWLVWLEIEPFVQGSDGINSREVRLMARNLSAELYDMDIVLDIGRSTMADGFYLPFDQLGLADDSLVYRGSVFRGGRRDTQVVWIDLATLTMRIIGQANGNAGRQILHCSISGTLIAWDVQVNFQVEIPGVEFPPQQQSRYTVYTYQTDSSRLPFGASPERLITQNDWYYAPFLFRETLLSMVVMPTRIAWTDQPIGPMGGDLFVNHRSYDHGIVQINPDFGSGRVLVLNSDYSEDIIAYYANLRSPRSIQRDNLFAGQRLVSWQCNVSEHHIVYDMGSFTYLELPVWFGDAYDMGKVMERVFMTQGAVPVPIGRAFTIWPNLQLIRVTHIPGADADYFYFEHIYDLEPAYILVVGG